MGSYQKADGITLSQLNNTEYTNFMNRVLTLLTAGSISKLTVTNIVNSIKPKLVQMEDLVNRSIEPLKVVPRPTPKQRIY